MSLPGSCGDDACSWSTRAIALVSVGGFVEFLEQWCAGAVADDGFGGVIHEEAFVERLIEQAAGIIGGMAVEAVWVAEGLQGLPEHLLTDGEFGAGIGQAGLDAGALDLDIAHLEADLIGGQRVVGKSVDQPGFLFGQSGQLAVEAGVEFASAGLLVVNGVIEMCSDNVDEVLGKLCGAVVLDDRVFDGGCRHMRKITQALLSDPALEVVVLAAGVAGGLCEDQPGGTSLPVAAATEQFAA
nr:hypothetical protein [Nocardia bovistercoris]